MPSTIRAHRYNHIVYVLWHYANSNCQVFAGSWLDDGGHVDYVIGLISNSFKREITEKLLRELFIAVITSDNWTVCVSVCVCAQDLALVSEETLPVYNRCAVHALTAAYLNLICQLTTLPTFCQHIHEVSAVPHTSDITSHITHTHTHIRVLRLRNTKTVCACSTTFLIIWLLLCLYVFVCLLQVIEMRQKEALFLLPEDVFIENPM